MRGSDAFLSLRRRAIDAVVDGSVESPRIEWPAGIDFNWARDYFDRLATDNPGPALRLVDDAGRDSSVTFSELARRSKQVANFLAGHGVVKGDRILIMLGNVTPLWETMLASIRLGAVVIPATTLLQGAAPR